MKVKVDKLSGNQNTFQTRLPLEGKLMRELEVGQQLFVSGGEYGGLVSSDIKELEETEAGWKVTTRNSVYEVTRLGE